MATKNLEELKKLAEGDKLVIGKDETMKALKTGSLSKVFVAKNIPKSVKEDINYYAELAKIEVVEIDRSNEELGTLCKKPFSISVLGVEK